MNNVVDIEIRRRIKLFRNSMKSNPNVIFIRDFLEFPICSLSYKDNIGEVVHLECLVIAKDINGDFYALDKNYKYWRFFKNDIVDFKP